MSVGKVTVYVNGKRVEKEDIKNIEIKSEIVKRIFASKLSPVNGCKDEKAGQKGE